MTLGTSSLFLRFAPCALIFALTAISAIAAIETSKHGVHIAAFWPANGIALVGLLRLRSKVSSRRAASVAIAAALLFANLICGNGLANSAWFTAGNLIEIAVAYALIRAPNLPRVIAGERGHLSRLLPRILLAGLVAPAFAAAVGAFGLSLGADASIGVLWMQWWLPSALGLLIVVPLGLFITQESLAKLSSRAALRDAAIGCALLAAALTSILFVERLAMLIFVSPVVMLAAVRFRALGAAFAIAVVAWFIIPITGGPDAMNYSTLPDTTQRLALVQSFLVLNVLVALALSALLDERESLASALEARRAEAADAANGRLRLLMNVAHEIRTPLNVVQGCTHLARGAGPLSAKQAELLDTAAAAARQIQALASDLLETARIEYGAVAIAPRRVEARATVTQAIEDVRASLGWTGEVQVDIADGAVLWADPVRLRQIVTNLVSNAVKYGGAYGAVKVGLRAEALECMFWVSDCGPGFQPGKEHAAFEPFAMARSTPATDASAGVGLSLVKQLVEAHGGRMSLTSTPFLETRIEAVFPAEGAPGAVVLSSDAAMRSVDPDSVF